MKQDNNRSFFRIDTMIPCGYRILTAEEANRKEPADIQDTQYIEEHFLNDLHKLDEQIKESIVKFSERSNVLGKTLAALDSKLNFIIQTIDTKSLSKSIPLRMVNISASGIMFNVEEKIDINSKVEILLQLPEEDAFIISCDVANIKPQTDGSSSVALKYKGISEENTRKIIFFIQTKELEVANNKHRNTGVDE